MSETSTKPYLLRAIYEWCTDNGFTPHLAAKVDANTRVPQQFVKNGEIVLNISFEATSSLKMDNQFVNFSARFGGVSREISVPVENVIAIYARENGQGMAFEVAIPTDGKSADAAMHSAPGKASPISSVPTLTSVPSPGTSTPENANGADPEKDPEPPKKGGRPTLTRIK
ncbi:ClpXP protease specificity-enhancing factor [Glaciimonas immobilis]|uniref:Stringent starvation protein B n=1 Tax=Glaciimonas immobilis TaxID=728004 RepID=A0A840RYA0_9BURK|nr:ClpXP protease specificity-enhancing factor [Glaciimonas immobilis]KAF3998522.1 ClpXP protease specificity-enhancing factor [Glaciimonas immobilis]MBB5201369.1 stringent starvation protein B [Glaciimonas immobilis]